MGAVAGMFNVFLNHRGPDVKKDFVAHLHEALLDAGLHPFTDMESLVKGQHGQTSIYEALRGASVHVAVFSKGYADSTYCLDELCAMLESKKLVIPVFYDVSPDDLLCTNKLQNGAYANAFRKTHKKQTQAQVEKWKKALHDCAGLFGFRLADYNGNAARLKKDIVIAVQKALPPSAQLQPVAKYAVGLDQSSRSVIETLNQMGDNVGVLSVVGMGGIGKTTLATEVFNHFAKNDTSKFEKQSFLKNVRENPVLDLQKQLVRDLLQQDVKTREDFNHWFNLFMGRKVLIVIDDIDKNPQFDQLIPEINKLARGSRVLITSRDRNLVANIMEKAECKHAWHEVGPLNKPDARQLFNSHAFASSNVTDGFHDVAQRVADACAGLPLALEVIGCFLFDKRKEHDLDCWEQTIKTLHEEKDVLDKLKISYDGLSTGASQLMFLDIACFFIGKHETMAMQIFESCSYDYDGPAASFSSLIDKSLVKLDGDGRIVMHDLLRDMGREVVKNQSLTDKAPPSHLWDPEMAERVLANREGTNRVRGLSVAGKGNGAACVAENYTSMKELHFLLLDGCDVKGDFSTWSLELSWLQWRSSPLSALPSKLDLLKLAVLDLTDSKSLTRIWPSDLEPEFPCKELQTLILENCSALEELPQNFGKLSILKDLNMRGCSTLEALPDSMGQLRELEHLNLSGCGKLGSLPDSIVHLSKLKTIQLNECTQLRSLPMAFGELQSLVEFWAEGSSLSHLPDTFSSLSNLEHLHLYKCSHIQDLPPSMSGLGKLKVLHMGQTRVQTLPEDFGKLGSLIELNLQECESLKSLPDNFGLLSELRKLVMHHNKSFVELPEGFGRLQALVELDLGTCSIEEKGLSSDFGNLSALRTLHLQYNKLATLPETFRDLGALVFLEMHHCPNLSDVQALPWNLEHMDIGNCPNLTDIPFLGKMSLLKNLILCNCTRLTQLQGLESLPSLVEINVAGCTMLENVSGLNHNRALEQCYLSGSKISMKYDDDWLKKEPATQVVSYYEDTLAFAHNGMAQKVTSKVWANELCMETIVTNPEECIAVIFSFVAHDQGWSDYPLHDGRYNSWCSMEARIVRNNEDVYNSSLFQLRHADRRDQMYLCTLRRLHPFVHALQHGDKIRVYARSIYPGWAITVEQGAVCVVHATKGELDHEKVHVVMNGGNEANPSDKSVSVSLADEVKVKLATLQLADNPKPRQYLLQVAPTFAALPAATAGIHLRDAQMVYTMPRSLRDLHNLVTLKIYHCLNLNDVEALPHSLQYLDICDCPKLMSIPSLDNLSLLRSLTLCKCTKLTQIQGLDSLTSLVEVNLTGCTMLQNAPGLNHNNTLEKCYLSGSKVSMPYDSNWLKKQPAEQVVSYYDSTLGFATNGMAVKVKSKNGRELCMETTVTEHKECIAVIFSFVAHDQGWSDYAHEHGRYNSQSSMEAHIIRDNEEIQTCELFRLRHADKKDQVYLCTLRKLHPFVSALRHGDKIRVYAQTRYQGWTITVEEGAVCVLHAAPGELDHEICVVVNGGNEASSSVGANLSSKEVKEKLTTLQLVDDASHQMNTVQQRIFSVDWVPVVNPQTGQPMIFQCKGCSCRPIITLRWHCDICPDFNLCSDCHKATSLQQLHNHEHPMSVASEPDGSFIFSGPNANVGPALTSDPRFNSWYSQQQRVPQIADDRMKDAHCKERTVGESETPGSMFGKLETNEMATDGEIGTPGSTLLTLETHETPTRGEIGNPGSMFMMFETHEMPASGEIGTHESIGAELETHEMPASDEIGTHESISAELETHEMPTCGEIQSPGFMFAKLETHQTPTVAEIETLGMDSQVYQHASESLIAFGWRLSLEDNALEFFFPNAHSMSRIVGVGLEFAKVVVSTSNLNVQIIGIGKTSWKNVWSNFTTLDKKLEVISLDGVTGAGSHNNSSNEYLTGEESASKYGVGLCSGNTVHAQFPDAPHESDYCLVLHYLVEYLMLKKVDLDKIGVQCTRDGGEGSSSHGGNSSDQANNNVTSLIGQGLSYISYLFKGKWKSNTGDDEDDLPGSKKAQNVEHDSAKKNICNLTVLPGAGGSFCNKEGTKLEEAPNGLDDASVNPKLEFEFDKNGKIGKQIYVKTTTTFDLGNAAPTGKVKNSFGWYHDDLKTTLRNPQRLAQLDCSYLLMGNPKDTKSSVRRTQTHSDNDESEVGAELQVGYQGTHLKGSFRKKGTKGVTFAQEEAYENCTSSDVWRGFIYQDSRSAIKSSACWKFTCNLPSPLPLKVLSDDNEWKKYLGSGMCGALEPIFDTTWCIQEEDDTEKSVYEFEAERTLNMLSTINGRNERLEIIQKYGLRMFVNHAMNHLSNVKDNHLLREWESVSEVMVVGFVTVLTSSSG